MNKETDKGPEDLLEQNKKPVISKQRNDMFVFNFSPLFCYNPIFGYNLEKLPKHNPQMLTLVKTTLNNT